MVRLGLPVMARSVTLPAPRGIADRWYVAAENSMTYLHSDGTLQPSANESNGFYRGWYDSEEEANVARNIYIAEHYND